jgi:hypothetical protein
LAVQETVTSDLPKNRALLGFSNCLRSLLLPRLSGSGFVERPRFIFKDVEMKNTSQETDDFRAELDEATQAIKGVRENLAGLKKPITESMDKLAIAIDKATEQANESSKSAAKLARSLNIITGCLVGVGIIQIFVCLWHR